MKKINILVVIVFLFANSYSFGFEHNNFSINNINYNGSLIKLNISNDFGLYEFKLGLVSDSTNTYWNDSFEMYFNQDENLININFETSYLNTGEYSLILDAYYNDIIVYTNELMLVDVESNLIEIESVNFYSLNSLEDFGYYKELIFELSIDSFNEFSYEIKYDLYNEYNEFISNYSNEINLDTGKNLIYLNINGSDIYESEKDGRYNLRNIELYLDEFLVGYYNSTYSDDASYIEFNDWNLTPIEEIEEGTKTEIKEVGGDIELKVETKRSSGGGSSGSSSGFNYPNYENIAKNESEYETIDENISSDIKEEINEIVENNVIENETIKTNEKIQNDSVKINFDEIEYNGLDTKTLGSAIVGIIMVIGVLFIIPK